MNAQIFVNNEFITYRNDCYYVDEFCKLWKITPGHDTKIAVIVICIKEFDISRGHPPYLKEVESEIEKQYK